MQRSRHKFKIQLYQPIRIPNITRIPETPQPIKYFCSASTKLKSILIVTKQENVHQRLMQRHRGHIQVIAIKQQVAQPRAGGGSGRPALFRLTPPMSTLTARSITMVAVSAMILTLFAPLCGSIWTLNSSNRKSSNVSVAHAVCRELICGDSRNLLTAVRRSHDF